MKAVWNRIGLMESQEICMRYGGLAFWGVWLYGVCELKSIQNMYTTKVIVHQQLIVKSF